MQARDGSDDAITVVIAEDQPVYREALEQIVSDHPELELSGSVRSGEEAEEAIASMKPAVVLLDLQLGGVNALEIARRVAASDSGTRVLFLSSHGEGRSVYEALAAGGHGYLTKLASAESICEAILSVAHGQGVIDTSVTRDLIRQIQVRARDLSPLLSPREIEILSLVADGDTTAQAAAKLHLSSATIKSHLQNVYGKLGVADRSAAVAEAIRRGLLQ
jgi:two-component system, NarL family, nitrate/nitrite response regulator NarL